MLKRTKKCRHCFSNIVLNHWMLVLVLFSFRLNQILRPNIRLKKEIFDVNWQRTIKNPENFNTRILVELYFLHTKHFRRSPRGPQQLVPSSKIRCRISSKTSKVKSHTMSDVSNLMKSNHHRHLTKKGWSIKSAIWDWWKTSELDELVSLIGKDTTDSWKGKSCIFCHLCFF